MKDKSGYGYLIDTLISISEVIIITVVYWALLAMMSTFYTRDFSENVTGSTLLLVTSYLIAVYRLPIVIANQIIYLDAIVRRLLLSCIILTLIFVLGSTLLNYKEQSIIFIFTLFCSIFFSLLVWRITARQLLKLYRRNRRNFKRVVIVGAGQNGMRLYEILSSDLSYGFNVLGFFDDNESLGEVLDNYLGNTDEVEAYLVDNKVDFVYTALPGAQDAKIMRIMTFAENHMIRIYVIPEFARTVKRTMKLEFLHTLPVLSLRREPLMQFDNRMLKRVFDILFSALFLITIFPFVFIVVAIAIKSNSRGPIFFVQKRTGIQGREFGLFKFRSMQVNGDSDEVQARQNDERLTSVGEFIRKTSIDELPQFINVLLGHMSIVGPRPHMLKHTEQYSSQIEKYMVRHLVKPGITGWAQVNGFRGETKDLMAMQKRVECDQWYIENWSFILDLKIIVVTIINACKGEENAY